MKTYKSISDVLADEANLEWSGTLFTNKAQWAKQPAAASFLYLDGDDELEDIVDDDTMLPRLAEEADMEYFLDVQLFNDVTAKQRELDANSTDADMIRALKHYREYDAFYWPK